MPLIFMKYRQIKTSFWEDGYILELSCLEKLLFLYLFTNPRVNLCGIYELADRTICYTLGCTLEELVFMKKKLEKDNKYAFYKGWVFIVNFTDHNKYSSAPNIVKSFLADFNSIPKEVINYFLNVLKLTYTPPIENNDTVMVMVMDKDKEGRGYPRIEAKVINEDVDPDTIPF